MIKTKTKNISNAILGIFLILMALSIQKITINNDIWLKDSDPIEINEDFNKTTFDSNASNLLIIISVDHKKYFNQENIDQLKEFVKNIKNRYQYYSAGSPLHSSIAISKDKYLSIKSFDESLSDGTIKDLTEYKNIIKDSDYFGQLISKDYKSFIINLKYQFSKNNPGQEKRKIVEIINSEANNFPQFGNYKLSGKIFLDSKLNDNIKLDIKKLFSITTITVLLCLLFIYRNIAKVLAAIYPAIISAIFTTHIINLHSGYFTALDIITLISVIAIAISDGTHIINKWQYIIEKHQSHTIKTQVKELFLISYRPCLITTVSTAIGFGSFYFSEVIPLKNFALTAFLAIMVSYINIILFTILIIFINHKTIGSKETQIRFKKIKENINNIIHFSISHKRSAILSTTLAIIVSIFLYKNNFNESNFINIFFKKSSESYKAINQLDSNFAGSGSVNLIIKTNQTNYFKEIKNFYKVNKLVNEINKLDNVTKVQSYINPIAQIHQKISNLEQKTKLPTKNDELEQELLFIEFSRSEDKKEIISQYVNFEYSDSRIIISTKNLTSIQLEKLTKQINDIIARSDFHQKIEFTFAGQNIYFLKINDYINSSFIQSILTTIAAITVIMAIVYHARLAIISAIISLIPFIIILGLISLLNIPYDYATIIIGATTFAIAIDNTIHLIDNYGKLKVEHLDNVKRIKTNLQIMYYPLTVNMIIFSATFLVFCLSEMVLLNKFGFFSFLNIIIAFLVNVILTTIFLHKKSSPF